MDHFPDPFEIDAGVLAIVLQQRDRDAGDGRGLHVRECERLPGSIRAKDLVLRLMAYKEATGGAVLG